MLDYTKDYLGKHCLNGKKNNEPVCFMNIDCDLYSSTKQVLCILNELIVKDTLIRFDDFFDSPINPYSKWLEGQWRALNEWTQNLTELYYLLQDLGKMVAR